MLPVLDTDSHCDDDMPGLGVDTVGIAVAHLAAGAWICMGVSYGLVSGPLMLRFVGPRRVAAGSARHDY
jgi:hypothetical protein